MNNKQVKLTKLPLKLNNTFKKYNDLYF